MSLEKNITEFFVNFCKQGLFFLSDNHQSLVISLIHYALFIVGFYYFFFYSKPGDYFRIFFFIFTLLGAIGYFTFNKCILTSVERSLSKEKNQIQKIIDRFFGEEIEGNITSKFVLLVGSIVTGIVLLRDYNYFSY
jgi:hypothetical protein